MQHPALPGFPAAWGGPPHPNPAYPGLKYRYTLWRTWEPDLFRSPEPFRFMMVVGLNPSTAWEEKDDPTVARCAKRAQQLGFDAMVMTNLFAYRATDPADMMAEEDPIGPENDEWLERLAQQAGLVLVAWGTHGSHLGRDQQVLPLLGSPFCLDINADHSPKHPLYCRTDQKLRPYSPPSL